MNFIEKGGGVVTLILKADSDTWKLAFNKLVANNLVKC